MEIGWHMVFNFAMDFLIRHLLNEKLYMVFDSLKYAAKLNIAFRLLFKSVEDGSCPYYYLHGNDTMMEWCTLSKHDVTRASVNVNIENTSRGVANQSEADIPNEPITVSKNTAVKQSVARKSKRRKKLRRTK